MEWDPPGSLPTWAWLGNAHEWFSKSSGGKWKETSLAVQWLRLCAPDRGGGSDSIPGWGTITPHASWPKKQKHKHHCNKSNKDLNIK